MIALFAPLKTYTLPPYCAEESAATLLPASVTWRSVAEPRLTARPPPIAVLARVAAVAPPTALSAMVEATAVSRAPFSTAMPAP